MWHRSRCKTLKDLQEVVKMLNWKSCRKIILKFHICETPNLCIMYVYAQQGKRRKINWMMLSMVSSGVVMVLEPEEWGRKASYTMPFCIVILTMVTYLCFTMW